MGLGRSGKLVFTAKVQRDLNRLLRRIDTYKKLLEPGSGASIQERRRARVELEKAKYQRNMIMSGYAVAGLADRYEPS